MKRRTVSIAVATAVLTGLGVYGVSAASAAPASPSSSGSAATVSSLVPIEPGNTDSSEAQMDAMMRQYVEQLPANARDEVWRAHEQMMKAMSAAGGVSMNSMMSGRGVMNSNTPSGTDG